MSTVRLRRHSAASGKPAAGSRLVSFPRITDLSSRLFYAGTSDSIPRYL